ncbi:carbohydrate-selective porin B [Acetobacter estunensis NRIC 0472]|uniref:Carbohydrate porin n=1 Tax=Acetobacter estunensis TaxID=104097 RepID=A0A967B4A0_9PROT|nr:carbohydrate porin [Acetobacter estunensis]NHO53472.1 carbohydrate porin [Acetobacter estunensis]GBQ28966.1 carbohydrate-selective porin B [Acetobacter estunensis NRIC 0472]
MKSFSFRDASPSLDGIRRSRAASVLPPGLRTTTCATLFALACIGGSEQAQAAASETDDGVVHLAPAPGAPQAAKGTHINKTSPRRSSDSDDEYVSEPAMLDEEQPIEPLYHAIPGFLESPYGPPSFGSPYGTHHLLGDWGGIQPWLQKRGLYLAINDYESLSGNPIGGKTHAVTDAGQTGVTLDVDWHKLLDGGEWSKNLWLHMLAVNGHGRNLSALMGDNANQVQQIYGARGNVVAHLVWMYFEKSWLDNRIDWSVGVMPPGTFFNNSPWGCAFMNVWMCGNTTPTKYVAGGRDWPSGNIGTVLRVMPRRDFYIMGGLFAVSPHSYNGGISGWALAQDGLGKLSGHLEFGWIPEFGPNHLIGHYKVGALYDNSKYNDLYSDIHGHPWVVTGLPARKQSGQTSMWAMVDQMFIRHGEGPMNGLMLGLQYSYASGQTSAMKQRFAVSVLDTGYYWNRPHDMFGFTFQWADFSKSAIRQQRASLAYDLPFQGANFGVPYGVQSHENIYEFFYTAQIVPGLSIQPDFQYINRLGGTKVFKDAAVFSMAFSATL